MQLSKSYLYSFNKFFESSFGKKKRTVTKDMKIGLYRYSKLRLVDESYSPEPIMMQWQVLETAF